MDRTKQLAKTPLKTKGSPGLRPGIFKFIEFTKLIKKDSYSRIGKKPSKLTGRSPVLPFSTSCQQE